MSRRIEHKKACYMGKEDYEWRWEREWSCTHCESLRSSCQGYLSRKWGESMNLQASVACRTWIGPLPAFGNRLRSIGLKDGNTDGGSKKERNWQRRPSWRSNITWSDSSASACQRPHLPFNVWPRFHITICTSRCLAACHQAYVPIHNSVRNELYNIVTRCLIQHFSIVSRLRSIS
jgi:hypothetical protein